MREERDWVVECGTRQVAGRAQCHCRARSQSATSGTQHRARNDGSFDSHWGQEVSGGSKKVCKKEVDGVQSSGCCGVEKASFRRKTDVGGMKEKRRCRLAAEVARKTKGGRHKNTGLAAQRRAAAHTPPAPPPVLSPLSLQPPRSSPTPQPPVNVAPGLSCLALGLLFVLGAPLSPNLLLATGFPFQLDLKDPLALSAFRPGRRPGSSEAMDRAPQAKNGPLPRASAGLGSPECSSQE